MGQCTTLVLLWKVNLCVWQHALVQTKPQDRGILTLWQSLFNSQTKRIFLPLSKAAKSALDILATGSQQGDQELCIQHLQWSNEGHIWKAVASWKTQTLHLSSLVAAYKGQGCDASDLKAQELRKGRDVAGILLWALFMACNTVSLLWKITWLLKSHLALQYSKGIVCTVLVTTLKGSLCPVSVLPQSINTSNKLVHPPNPQHQLSSPHSHTGWC